MTSAYVGRAFQARRRGGPGRAALLLTAILATASLARAAELTSVGAAERADRAAVLRMLAKGANPNTAGPDGTTAVMYAAANDDVELVRALVRAGANVRLKNQLGTSALTEAATIGSAAIIDVLLKAG